MVYLYVPVYLPLCDSENRSPGRKGDRVDEIPYLLIDGRLFSNADLLVG